MMTRTAIRLCLAMLVLAVASVDGASRDPRPTGTAQFPMCSEICDSGASCAEDCEIGTEFGWIFTTCGEYENGWDGGFCEVPEDVWDTHIEPNVTVLQTTMPTDEYDPIYDTWITAIEEIDLAVTGDYETEHDWDVIATVLYNYGLVDQLYAIESSPAPSVEFLAPSSQGAIDTPDGSGVPVAPSGRVPVNVGFGECDDKWDNAWEKGGMAVGMGIVAAAAGYFAIWAPVPPNIKVKAGRIAVGAAVASAGFAYATYSIVNTPCNN